jgi:transcriptional regulator with AAA-type ATPase domain
MRLAGSEKTQHWLVILYEVSALFRPHRACLGLFLRASRLQIRSDRMAALIADRFLCIGLDGSVVRDDYAGLDFRRATRALDLATGARVWLRIDAAGSHAEQQLWTETCARAHGEGTLLDFGFAGSAHRFEARLRRAAGRGRAHDAREAIDWLEHARPSSSRILHVTELPDARALRLRGCVPCNAGLLEDAALADILPAALRGRSVVLLDSHGPPLQAALTILRLRTCGVRELWLFTVRGHSKHIRVQNAAERRAMYGGRVAASDPRVAQMMIEAGRLLSRGRHAAAERTLRGAVAAFDRRGDFRRAGDAALTLGRLLLTRGRAADAKDVLSGAQDQFQRARAAHEALDATVYLGLAQTDLGLLREAEQTCRAAYSAAAALDHPDAVLLPAIALVRVLLWQQRYADARAILEAVTPSGNPEQCARYWCLAARLQIALDAVADAWRAVERARPAASSLSPAIESVVRECQAAVQGRLGDIDALRIHVAHGLTAARAAHLPLQAVKLRLTFVEALVRAGRGAQARSAARHLGELRSSAVPPLLKKRIETVFNDANRTPAVHETAAHFQAGTTPSDVNDLDGLRDLLASSHQFESENDALARAAAVIRRHTHAIGVAIFGWHKSAPRPFAAAGITGDAIARRAVDIGQPIAACAPLIYVLIERHGIPPQPDAAHDLVGISAAIQDLRKAIARAANAPFTVLLEGESGSGKELVARAIHRAGSRRERRFSALNCAAMPEDLVDAELFGHAKGAFTGAAVERLGLFESADGGTVFLDEVGELSARAQAKVLRVLQEGEIRRIGENFTRAIDARLIAATNRSLRAEVDAGRFRQDLLYRLDVIRISVPPLRERVEDIPLLAARFWQQSAERVGSKAVLGQGALCALARYDWPGNVRELQNVLMALVVAAPRRGVVSASELPSAIARSTQVAAHESLESARLKFEERFVRAALARAAGHRGKTAAALGLTRQGLAKLMQRLHLDA